MDQAAASNARILDNALDARALRPGEIVDTSPDGENRPPAAKPKHIYAGREWTAEHPLNVRVSIPLFFGRYYLTLVAGKERRARARLASDRRQNPLDTPGNVLFLFLVGVVAAAGSVALIYLLLAYVFGWSGRLVF